MRIGFISTRLSGTDGVSLEVEKWSKVLEEMGHELFYCAGELGGYARDGTQIPKLHFADKSIQKISRAAFDSEVEVDASKLVDDIYQYADELRSPLRSFIRTNKLELIIVQNALTIPMNLPLGVCLTGLIAELGIRTVAHHHDFFGSASGIRPTGSWTCWIPLSLPSFRRSSTSRSIPSPNSA